MGKSSAPQPPNYEQLAELQGQQSVNLLNQQTTANRPNTTTPFGSTMWNAPATPGGQWSATETLNPTLNSTLQTQEGTQLGQSQIQNAELGLQGNLFNTEGGNLYQPVNYSNVNPNIQGGNYFTPQAEEATWNQFQTMQEPLQQQQTQSQQAQLEAQGLRPGDPAYNTAMTNLSNTQYQQQQTAEDQAVLSGEQEAQTMQGMNINASNTNLNTANSEEQNQLSLWNSLMQQPGGVGNPNTTIGAPNAGVAQTPNLLNAGESAYEAAINSTNVGNANASNLFSGILGTAGAAYGAYEAGSSADALAAIAAAM